MIVVFDFDKTLTYKDSLSEVFKFYLRGRYFLILVYFFLKVLSRSHIITVEREKIYMIRLLFNSNYDLFKQACESIGDKLKLTPIVDIAREHVEHGNLVIILSAAPQVLIDKIMSVAQVEAQVLATEFEVVSNKIIKITQHPYSSEKKRILQQYNIKKIDQMYYDSKSDECLIPLSNESYLVHKGVVVRTFKLSE